MFPFVQTTRARQRWVTCCLLCWVLVWATPLLAQPGLTLVCSGGGVKWVNLDGKPEHLATASPDCALCLPSALPAPEAAAAFAPSAPCFLLALHGEHRAPPAPEAMPPPARGPPLPVTVTPTPTQKVST